MKVLKYLLTILCLCTPLCIISCSSQKKQRNIEFEHYLFAYFTSNTTDGQQLRFAVSDDGLNYTALNDNEPVVRFDSIAYSGAIRDPHILRCNDGWFRMVLTDMDWEKGKWSNRGIVMMRSRNLIDWESNIVHFPDRFEGHDAAKANAVWAPQTIFDTSTEKYMVYFSLHSDPDGPFPVDAVYYSYANDDFSGLETEPQRLFIFDGPSIDTDIVKDEKGLYHLFFNTWGGPEGTRRRQFEFTDIHNQASWNLIEGHQQPNNKNSEGSTAFQLIDGGWVLCYDCFRDGEFEFCRTDDFRAYKLVHTTKTTDKFNPRHGSVIPITKEEYLLLCNKYKK